MKSGPGQGAAGNGRERMPEAFGQAMRSLPLYFRPEKAGDARAVVHISTVGPAPGNWLVTVRDGQCRVDEGSVVNPSLVINAPSDVWLKIMRREIDGAKAYERGEFAFSGDAGVLMQLEDWFE
jgi:putative sterol carrier protein